MKTERLELEAHLLDQGVKPEIIYPCLDCWFHLLARHDTLRSEVSEKSFLAEIAQYCFFQGFLAASLSKKKVG